MTMSKEALSERTISSEASSLRAQAAVVRQAQAEELGDDLDVAKRLKTVLRLCAAGYLSKGYGQFKQARMADPAEREWYHRGYW